MKMQIQILLASTVLFSSFSYSEAHVDQQPAPVQQIVPEVSANNQTEGDKNISHIEKKWNDAKDATQKALQQSKEAGETLWEAGKESSQEIWSDSKALGNEVWNNVKEKSTDILEKGNTLLENTNETLEGLLDKKDENKKETEKSKNTTADNII